MCLRLVLVWAVAAAAPDPWLSDVGLKMHSDLYEAIGKIEVNYSTPVINATYVARVEFDMRAMGMLYNSTHMIIDFIANEQAYPEGARNGPYRTGTPSYVTRLNVLCALQAHAAHGCPSL
ncbi:hypothetical protein RR46_04283 [Papilio xuthus]|uniref:Uncharacterized protein n=1 Tax=Papilio xuthus TaxID=66420 RepID=A0A194QJP1_PAPXU|nr:hypothetical protein RR46_04283 [Papilio xuthus]